MAASAVSSRPGATVLRAVPPAKLAAPAAEAAERAVLGACLSDASCYWRAVEIVKPADFYSEPNAYIFQAMTDLANKDTAIDLITVTDRMLAAGTLVAAGGAAYVSSVAEGLPDPANVEYYARIVREHAERRTLINIGAQLVQVAAAGNQPARDMAESAISAALNAVDVGSSTDAGEAHEIGAAVLAEAERRRKGNLGLTGWRTGLIGLDKVLRPLAPGQLITIGAGTGCGKTSLALQIVGNVIGAGASAYIVSLEMSKEEVVTRILAQRAGVPSSCIEEFRLMREEVQRVTEAQDWLADRHLWIDGYRGMGIPVLRARLKARQHRGPLDFVVVDYLQLMVTEGRADNRTAEVGKITRGLKVLAGEFGVPILALSQLSRNYDARIEASARQRTADGELAPLPLPTKSDLRESGSIEQDSDVVLLLHRDTRPASPPEVRRRAKVVVAKQRAGREAEIVDMLWQPDWQVFE